VTRFFAIVAREVRLSWVGGGLWLPVIFYLSVATLYPFVTGPDKALLARTGGGILWIAALLATLLPIERLVLPDRQSGVLDQLALRGWSDELVASAKIIGHIISFALPLLLASIIASVLIGLPEAQRSWPDWPSPCPRSPGCQSRSRR
jgi:heme exporter protein B